MTLPIFARRCTSRATTCSPSVVTSLTYWAEPQEDCMKHPNSIRAIAHAVALSTIALLTSIGAAQAHDESKYPNLKGQWERFVVRGLPGQASFDQTKGWGTYQQAPL